MAIDAQTLAEGPPGVNTRVGKPTTTPDSTAPAPKVTEFKTNIFMMETGTGVKVDNRGRKEEGKKSEFSGFSESLKEQYVTFLDNYITGLSKLKEIIPDPNNPGRSVYDAVMSNPQHVFDKQLVEHLSGTQLPGERGDVVGSETDEIKSKIEKFLEKPEAWIIATQLLEQHITMQLFALGLNAANNPRGERQALPDEITIRLNEGQGTLNRFWHETIDPNRQRILGAVGGVGATLAATSAGVALANSFLGAFGGAAPLAIYGGIRTIQSIMRDGLRVDLRRCSAAFQAIDSDATERAYVYAVMGIDTNDFMDRGNNVIGLRPGHTPRTTQNAEALKAQVIGALHTRQKLYEGLGVPENRLDALPEQFLSQSVDGQEEKTGARWQKEIQDEFIRLQRHLLLGGAILGTTENLQLRMEARRNIMARQLNKYLEKERARKNTDNSPTTLAYMKKQREEGGALKTVKEKEINDKKGAMEQDKIGLQGEQTILNTYKDSLTALQNARNEAQRDFGAFNIADIDIQIGLRQNRLDEMTPPVLPALGSVAYRRDQLSTQMLNDARAKQALIPGGLSLKERERQENLIGQSVERAYKARLLTLDREEEHIVKGITRLGELRGLIEQGGENLSDNNSTAQQANEKLTALRTELTIITTWGAVGLAQTDLQTETFEELIIRINTAHTVNNTHGWPLERNGRPEVRMRLLNAMIEAKAIQTEATDPIHAARTLHLNTLINPATWNITENQLRGAQPDELYLRLIAMTTANPGLLPLPIPAAVADAIEEAQDRLRIRLNTIERSITTTDESIRDQEESLKAINFDREIEQIDATINLAKRATDKEIFDGDKVAAITHDLAHYADSVNIADTDTMYSKTERAIGVSEHIPKGYYEMVDYLFGYKQSTAPPREQYFRTIHQLLPPARLADVLNRSLDINLPPPPVTLGNVFDRIRLNRPSTYEMGKALRKIIYEVKEQSLAL